jgi:AcrR family transcriptional regulator
MAATSTPVPGDPGHAEDPRVTRTRAMVLDSAVAILAEQGMAAFTIEGVVARSGVAKTTIYRHWPNKQDLLAAAMEQFQSRDAAPDTGRLREDLIDLLSMLAHALQEDAWSKSLPSIIAAAEHDPFLADRHAKVVKFKSTALREVLERARQRGELREDVDIDLAMDALAGTLFFRRLVLHGRTTRGQVAKLVDLAVDGLVRPPARRRRP